jgi:hypothetical protein
VDGIAVEAVAVLGAVVAGLAALRQLVARQLLGAVVDIDTVGPAPSHPRPSRRGHKLLGGWLSSAPWRWPAVTSR